MTRNIQDERIEATTRRNGLKGKFGVHGRRLMNERCKRPPCAQKPGISRARGHGLRIADNDRDGGLSRRRAISTESSLVVSIILLFYRGEDQHQQMERSRDQGIKGSRMAFSVGFEGSGRWHWLQVAGCSSQFGVCSLQFAVSGREWQQVTSSFKMEDVYS